MVAASAGTAAGFGSEPVNASAATLNVKASESGLAMPLLSFTTPDFSVTLQLEPAAMAVGSSGMITSDGPRGHVNALPFGE